MLLSTNINSSNATRLNQRRIMYKINYTFKSKCHKTLTGRYKIKDWVWFWFVNPTFWFFNFNFGSYLSVPYFVLFSKAIWLDSNARKLWSFQDRYQVKNIKSVQPDPFSSSFLTIFIKLIQDNKCSVLSLKYWGEKYTSIFDIHFLKIQVFFGRSVAYHIGHII